MLKCKPNVNKKRKPLGLHNSGVHVWNQPLRAYGLIVNIKCKFVIHKSESYICDFMQVGSLSCWKPIIIHNYL